MELIKTQSYELLENIYAFDYSCYYMDSNFI